MLRKAALVVVYIIAWGWALLAGVGGLVLLIHEGPLPITNGWFAMFSGLAACPLTAWALRRYARISVSRNLQFEVALAIFLAGRVAVMLILHRPFLPI
jgi:TctA family transporter